MSLQIATWIARRAHDGKRKIVFSRPKIRVHEIRRIDKIPHAKSGQENDDSRGADGRVLVGESQAACLLIDPESRHGVATLIAGKEEIARWVQGDAARVVPAGPFFTNVSERAITADREEGDRIMQAIGAVDEPGVGRYSDF